MNSSVKIQLKTQLIVKRMHGFTSVLSLPCLAVFSMIFICALPLPVRSQIFTCKDSAGRTISSDHPMPECADRAMRELSNTGLLRREIPAPLNAEQKRQQQLLEDKRRVAAALVEEQRQQDRALLARYRSESDIAASRRYYLGLSQDMIKRDQAFILDAENQLKQAQADTEFYKNRKLPGNVQWRIDDAHHALEGGKTSLNEHQKEAAVINAKFDETLARYRALTISQSTASNR